MANKCFKLLRFVAARITMLEPNGVPQPGAAKQYTTDSQISLAIGYSNEAGDDFTQKNGAGAICFAFLEPDKYKNLTLALSLCDHSPDWNYMLLGGDKIVSGADTIGHALPRVGTPGNQDGVVLEGWTYNIDGSGIDADYPYVRHVFGKSIWRPADKTLENNPIVNDFAGVGYENTNLYDGPANDFPDPTVSDSLYQWFGDTAIPTASCGAVALSAS